MSWKSLIVLALVGLSAVPQQANAQCTSIAAAATNAGLTTLVAAVTATGLAPALSNTTASAAPLTVFAPTNDAFLPVLKLLNKTGLDQLTPGELETVKQVLMLHVVGGAYPAASIVAGTANLTTLAGQKLTSDGATVSSDGNTAKIVTADAVPNLCGGSVVHVIDTVLLPEALATMAAAMMPPGMMAPPGTPMTSTMPPPSTTMSTMPPPTATTPTGSAGAHSLAAAAAMVALASLVMV